MSKPKPICGFCKREVQPDEDATFIRFPDGAAHAAHMRHPGVKEEHEYQYA